MKILLESVHVNQQWKSVLSACERIVKSLQTPLCVSHPSKCFGNTNSFSLLCPKQIIKKGLVMLLLPERKLMGWQYKNHCPISSQKSGGRPSGNEKQPWLTEINNYRIKINSFRKSVKEDRTLTKSGSVQNWQQLKRKQSGELSSRKYRQYITDVLGYGEQLLETCRKFAVNNQTRVKRSCQLLFLKSSKAATGSPNR